MRIIRGIVCCLILGSSTTLQAQSAPDLKLLYTGHKWVELGLALQKKNAGATTPAMSLYRGAIGVMFNQDPKGAEKMLISVTRSAPHSEEAYEAWEWLSHLYLYRGQYQSLISAMNSRWAAFPDKAATPQERSAMAGFRRLPNQIVERVAAGTLNHERDSIFIPASINGVTANYFFDTGAWASAMSESEAKRLGMTMNESTGEMGNSSGSTFRFRSAVAKELVVGNIRFRNVSFIVFPDSEEPWSTLSPGRRGILGVPLLVGSQRLRWTREGTLELGGRPGRFDIRNANLLFDNDHLAVSATVGERQIAGTLDTGAQSTDLYKPFADTFAEMLSATGKKDSTEVRGVGHAETFDSITLPELRMKLGGVDTVLRPAHVLLKSIGAGCCLGNFGMDLLKQAPAFTIDFGAMTLQLESR